MNQDETDWPLLVWAFVMMTLATIGLGLLVWALGRGA